MGLLTVFANFRIDSEERFLRMKDSFDSFSNANIEKWVVNVRGPYKDKTSEFLKERLGDILVLYELESKEGWFNDTRQMLREINSEFVFFWLEDHICLSGVDYFNRVVCDMKITKSECLLYSAFHNGDTLKSFDGLTSKVASSIIYLDYDVEGHKSRLEFISDNKLISPSFIVSTCSIFDTLLFKKIISCDDPLVKRWPTETPFDFEKTQNDFHWLPIKIAQTKEEFFAFIDDDHGNINHSLISRGLYPNRVSREAMLEVRNKRLSGNKYLFFIKRNSLAELLKNKFQSMLNKFRKL